MADSLQILLQHLLPKQHLTIFAGRVAGKQASWLTPRLIRWFVRKYGVDMNEAANPDIAGYASFNEFFTRPLKRGARPMAAADFVSPVDGAISQIGAIDDHHILQAKGHRFTTTELVGGDVTLAAKFRHGSLQTCNSRQRITTGCTCRVRANGPVVSWSISIVEVLVHSVLVILLEYVFYQWRLR